MEIRSPPKFCIVIILSEAGASVAVCTCKRLGIELQINLLKSQALIDYPMVFRIASHPSAASWHQIGQRATQSGQDHLIKIEQIPI